MATKITLVRFDEERARRYRLSLLYEPHEDIEPYVFMAITPEGGIYRDDARSNSKEFYLCLGRSSYVCIGETFMEWCFYHVIKEWDAGVTFRYKIRMEELSYGEFLQLPTYEPVPKQLKPSEQAQGLFKLQHRPSHSGDTPR